MSSSSRAWALMMGGVAGGLLWGALEVLGFIAKALLPGAALGQNLLPPRDLAGFASVALGTYAILGLLAGCGFALVLRPLLAGRTAPVQSFAAAAALSWWGLASVAVVVWTSMLMSGPLITGRSLAFFAAGILAAAVLALALLWLPLRKVGSVAVGFGVAGLGAPVLLLAVAWPIHQSIEFPQIPATGEPRPGLPNILFVTIDTLRADEVGPYSDGPVQTPTLERLSREGVLFEDAISHVPTTTPSHVSIFTSVYPFAHQAENGIPVRPDIATLTTSLKRAGYHTAGFASAFTTKSNVTGLGPGFDVYVDSLHPDIAFLSADTVEPLVFWRLIDRMSGNELDAGTINRRVRDWLDERPPEPFFAWVHYFDPHRPYDPEPEWQKLYEPADDSRRERELALYRGEITYTDHHLGRLLEDFQARGLLEDAIVVVTSDHGQGFGEPTAHVDWSHGRFLYDSVLRVPLIFWGPDRIPAGLRLERQVETIDIAPTLLSLVGEEAPRDFAGRPLDAALRGEDGKALDGPAFSENSSLYRPRRMAVRTPEWKLIVSPETGEEELYDLSTDAVENKNLVDQHDDVAQRLREQLYGIVGKDSERAGAQEMDTETLERLKALGYVPDAE